MSDEGLFKKRIENEFKVAYDLCYSPLHPQNTAECAGVINVGMKPNVLKIVEDAKKEWNEIPEKAKEQWKKTAQFSHHFGMERQEVNLRMRLHYQHIELEMKRQWFVKWLGKAEEVKRDE